MGGDMGGEGDGTAGWAGPRDSPWRPARSGHLSYSQASGTVPSALDTDTEKLPGSGRSDHREPQAHAVPVLRRAQCCEAHRGRAGDPGLPPREGAERAGPEDLLGLGPARAARARRGGGCKRSSACVFLQALKARSRAFMLRLSKQTPETRLYLKGIV